MIFSCSTREYQTPLIEKFDSNKGIELITQNGNAFRIPPNSFEDKNGNEYSGKVVFQLLEIYSKKDMIEHDLTTSSNGKLLVSGGMFYLSAKTEKGENLEIKESSSIGLCAKLTSNEKNYKGFYGVRTEEGLNWIQETRNEANNFTSNADFHHSRDCIGDYIFNVNKLGWINIDYFENSLPIGTLVVKSIEENLKIRLVFNDINSMLLFSKKQNGNYELKGLPINRNAKIVAYKKQDSKIKFYKKEIKIDTTQTLEIKLDEIDVEKFKKAIQSL